MGYAVRNSGTFTHRVVTLDQLLFTRVAVTPLDPVVNTLRVATADGWYEGRVVRLPSWTRVRTSLGVAVRCTAHRFYLLRLALEVTVVAVAAWLAVSSVW